MTTKNTKIKQIKTASVVAGRQLVMINDWDGYQVNTKQNSEFLKNYVVGRPKASFSARFCAYFQILRSLPE